MVSAVMICEMEASETMSVSTSKMRAFTRAKTPSKWTSSAIAAFMIEIMTGTVSASHVIYTII